MTRLSCLLASILVCATAAGAAGARTLERGAGPAPPALALTSASLNASWKESWLTGTLRFSGTVGAPGATITAVLRPLDRSGSPIAVGTLNPSGDAFSGTLKLPARPLPGRYRLTVDGVASGQQLDAATRDLVLSAPREGIVDKAVASAAKGARAVNTVRGPRKVLWARFHFVVPPKNGIVHVAWHSPDFRWYGIKDKPPVGRVVDTYVQSTEPLMRGVWFCFASSGGRVVKRVRIRIS
jgi:hypothetical protein